MTGGRNGETSGELKWNYEERADHQNISRNRTQKSKDEDCPCASRNVSAIE